jgi:hypothetical protein
VSVDYDTEVSDHFPLHFSFNTTVANRTWKNCSFSRKYNSIILSAFSDNLAIALAAKNSILQRCTLLEFMDDFNDVVQTCLDKHAPLVKCKIKYKTRPPWLDHEYVVERAKRRKLEKKFKMSRSHDDMTNFIAQRRHCNTLVKSKRFGYYKTTISACNGDQKALFKFVKRLLDTDLNRFPVILDAESNIKDDSSLASDFNQYFFDKIEYIRTNLPYSPSVTYTKDLCKPPVPSNHSPCLSDFDPCTELEIKQILIASGCKTSTSDILPSFMLSYCIDELLPYLTHLVNLSLTTSSMDSLKDARVRPLVKNGSCNKDLFHSYRPISNLSFISKLTERVVLSRLNKHLVANNLENHKQFG